MIILVDHGNHLLHNKRQLAAANHKCKSFDIQSLCDKSHTLKHNIIVIPLSCPADDNLTKALETLSYSNLILAAAGNDGDNHGVMYPASLTSVLAVGSHDEQNRVHSFTNTDAVNNNIPDIFAYGIDGGRRGTSVAVINAAITLSNLDFNRPSGRPIEYVRKHRVISGLCWKQCQSHLKRHVPKKPSNDHIQKMVGPIDITLSEITSLSWGAHGGSRLTLKYKSSHPPAKPVENTKRILSTLEEITLPLSGGIDSEVIATTLIDMGKPFTPILMEYYINGQIMNEHDLQWARAFCDDHQLTRKEIALDVVEFFKSGSHLLYATEYYCRSPQLACHLWMLNRLDNYVIAGDPPIATTMGLACPPQMYFSYEHHQLKNHKNCVPKLFWYDTDMIRSWVRVPKGTSTYESKIARYQAAGFRIHSTRRTEKLTGFEKIKEWYDDEYKGVRVFDSFYRRPMEELISPNLEFYYDEKYDEN